jgi:antitoxin YqcF
MGVSAENREIARHALYAFGGAPSVHAYYHDTEKLSVDLLRCVDRPCRGITSYSTIGLSDHPMLKDGAAFPTRLEIAGACATSADSFANVLASAAFCVMRTGMLCYPGRALPGYVREYFPSTTVPHLYFTAPFLWEDRLKTLNCGSKSVSWLLVVPISDAEREHLEKHGDDALEELFQMHEIDIFDLSRASVC